MAARGAGAAIEGASRWIPGLRNPGNFYGSGCRIPGGAQGSRFCRRSKRSNRILVGAQSTRSAPVFGSRPCQTQRYGDRRDGRQYIGTGSQGGHDHYSSRLHDGRRSGSPGNSHECESARRQFDGGKFLFRLAWPQAARIAARTCPECAIRWVLDRSDHSRRRAPTRKHSGGSKWRRPATPDPSCQDGHDIYAAYATVVKQGIGTLLVGSSTALYERMDRIVALAIRHAVPVCYYERQFVEAGGLMSYGARRSDAYRQAGIYTGKILKGERPADLPIVFPNRFELVINRRMAK